MAGLTYAVSPLHLVFAVALVVSINATDVSAQQLNWAQKMLEKQSIDFGVVARGADCSTKLKVRNLYREDIQITNVRTSCGCSKAEKTVDVIPSGQEAYINISMDTVRFMRRKDSAALVTFYEPTKGLSQEVRIPLTVYIRTDVVLTPGNVNFGIVEVGQPAKQSIEVAYAGSADWRINEVKVSNQLFQAEAVEVERLGGTVKYRLNVTMAAAPTAGLVTDTLQLVTTDANNPLVPVPVEARVEADIMVTPAELQYGAVRIGQSKVMNVVIRGRKPFTIEKLEREKGDEAFKVRLPSESRPVHVLPLTFAPTEGAGDYEDVFTITIADRPEPVTFRVKAFIETVTPGS